MAFTLKINGTPHEVDVDGDTPLLWVLRDVLGMTGTKFGCGQALCGACTVHVDGTATRSCITTVDSIGESAITTIEGSARRRRARPCRSRGWSWRWCSAATASPAQAASVHVVAAHHLAIPELHDVTKRRPHRLGHPSAG